MEKLISTIKGIKGCQMANIMYLADGGIPQYVLGKGMLVTKIVKTDCQLNYNYENAVNNRLAKQGSEGNFVAQSLPWGEWETPNKIIKHKGCLYLRYYDVANANVSSFWLVNGRLATDSEVSKIREYLRNKNTDSKRQADAGLVEHQVKPKVVKMENILQLNVNKVHYSKEHKYPMVG